VRLAGSSAKASHSFSLISQEAKVEEELTDYPLKGFMSGIEKRKHSRISISVPVSCVSIDQEGSPLNFNMGVVKDISQGGLALEVFREMESDLVLLSFVDVAGKTIELRGKSVYSKRNNSGTIKLGVLLLGKPSENIDFVKALVRFHHYTKKSTLTKTD